VSSAPLKAGVWNVPRLWAEQGRERSKCTGKRVVEQQEPIRVGGSSGGCSPTCSGKRRGTSSWSQGLEFRSRSSAGYSEWRRSRSRRQLLGPVEGGDGFVPSPDERESPPQVRVGESREWIDFNDSLDVFQGLILPLPGVLEKCRIPVPGRNALGIQFQGPSELIFGAVKLP
jgi:hypothetical protein